MHRDHALIQRIYDAAIRPENYGDVLQEISERVGAYGAMVFDCMQTDDGRKVGLQHLSQAYDRDAILAYVTAYNDAEVADQDRLADLSSSGNEINLIHDKVLYRGDYTPGPNLSAMLRRGVSDRYGSLLSKESWNTDRFAFQFLKGTTLPTPEQVAWAEDILAHVAKAMSIGRAISHHRVLEMAMLQYLDTLPIGVGIVDARGRVVHANRELNRIAEDDTGLSISREGAIAISDPGEAGKVAAMMSELSAHGRFGARPRREAVFIQSTDSDTGLFIEICPIESHPELDNFGPGTRLISVLDGSVGRRISPETVARFFPLSTSEVEVLGLVSDGYSNAEIAEQRSRSVETVNSQIKSLLRKTNARNRTELVKVAMGLSSIGGIDQD